jgi:hypothetical protein
MSMRASDVWVFGGTLHAETDLTGFKVEARDGEIGKVDEARRAGGVGYLVVDTGSWIFGKKVMLPGGVISDIDLDSETVFIDRTKNEIKNAPEFDEAALRDTEYLDELGAYYGARPVAPSGLTSRPERAG